MGAWLVGSAAMPPATALAEEGEEANDGISDHRWFDARKGTFGILGSAKSKGSFDKIPKAHAVVGGSVLALYDDGAKITVRYDADETDVVAASSGHHIASFDASPKVLAWIESNDSDCVLHASPFALTPMGRSAPLKPKELGGVPCAGANAIAALRGWILAGNDLVQMTDGKRVALASTVCSGTASPACARDALLGATESNVYFLSAGKVHRVPIASIAGASTVLSKQRRRARRRERGSTLNGEGVPIPTRRAGVPRLPPTRRA